MESGRLRTKITISQCIQVLLCRKQFNHMPTVTVELTPFRVFTVVNLSSMYMMCFIVL